MIRVGDLKRTINESLIDSAAEAAIAILDAAELKDDDIVGAARLHKFVMVFIEDRCAAQGWELRPCLQKIEGEWEIGKTSLPDTLKMAGDLAMDKLKWKATRGHQG